MRRGPGNALALPSTDEVIEFFDSWTFFKGQTYYEKGAVIEWTVEDEGCVVGLVQGTKRQPYEASVCYDSEGLVETECTCPVGFNCKHAVALMLAASFHHYSGTSGGGTALSHEHKTGSSAPGSDRLSYSLYAENESRSDSFGNAVSDTVSPAGPLTASRQTDHLSGDLPDAVRAWLQDSFAAATRLTDKSIAKPHQQILYIFRRNGNALFIDLELARSLQSGGYGIAQPWEFHKQLTSIAQHVTDEDRAIANLFRSGRKDHQWANGLVPDDPDILALVLSRIVATGRAFFDNKDTLPLRVGAERQGEIIWRLQSSGTQKAEVSGGEDLEVFSCASPWYIDTSSREAGPLRIDLAPNLVRWIMQAPPVEPSYAQVIARHLQSLAPGVDIPLPRTDLNERSVLLPPEPRLRLTARTASYQDSSKYSYPLTSAGRPYDLAKIPCASLSFDYGGKRFDSRMKEHRELIGNTIVVSRPDADAEAECLKMLGQLGLLKMLGHSGLESRHTFCFRPEDTLKWLSFAQQEISKLRRIGWQVDIDDSFPFRTVNPDSDSWSTTVTEEGGFWFAVELGIQVEGKKLPLLPVLLSALRSMEKSPSLATIEKLNFDGQFLAPMPDGRLLALPFDRVRLMMHAFVELFDLKKPPKGGKLSISLLQAAQLSELSRSRGWHWSGPQRLHELMDRMHKWQGIEPVVPPSSFKATLRHYQQEGLGWLQFLKDFGLGGILADDMGLGKTVQVLAHLCVEKARGKLDKPALVVCPTSVVPNWIQEADKFAPHLKVVSLYGLDRLSRFDDIRAADLAITTYALLRFDTELLAEREWSILILDEAQAIKNPETATAQAAKYLKAKHRICLTGTPVENHLGELWSQFDFLMPGILGARDTFRKQFRVPIEEGNDSEMKRILATRLRPLILRRTKAEVARELPEKTEILQRFLLEGDQRDLYETVRLAMHDKVRKEIASKGFKKSQIIILEALLKLRQVCCDPRLLKLPAAQQVKSSAKLSLLKELLPELIEDGRRVLIFSQFTSMLDLIAPELHALGLQYVEIRGNTKDRRSPVERFQREEVPVFLLSLKAGGTGLNLTAADTVIHYDPWWNPAVETQATDRAHRIGQTKPVFVYKLIAMGTVEDKLLELQERKKAIANSIYEHEKDGSLQFDESDLELLFRPIS